MLESGKAENRYLLTGVSSIVTLFFIVGCGLTGLGVLFVQQPLAMMLVYLGLWVAAVGFLPRRLSFEQPYKREPRAIRLLLMSFWVEFIPLVIILGLIENLLTAIFDPKNSPESSILIFGYYFFVLALGICAGPFAFALTPYSVVGGQLINRLIEWVFRLQVG